MQAADLAGQPAELLRLAHDVDVAEAAVAFVTDGHRRADGIPLVEHQAEGAVDLLPHLTPARPGAAAPLREDRTRAVSGKSVSVRVDLGGPRIITTTKHIT